MLSRVCGIDFNMIEIKPSYDEEGHRDISIWFNAENILCSDSRDVSQTARKRVS